MRIPGVADFEIDLTGTFIHCIGAPDASKEDIQHFYQNQIVPLALSRQNQLVLHAAAVEVDTSAICFVGSSGSGKSTLTASFARHGYRFLTDDSLHIQNLSDGYCALPGQPSIRLWQDSVKSLKQNPDTSPPTNNRGKTYLKPDSELLFCNQSRPIQAIFLLGSGVCESVIITPCTAGDALSKILSQSYILDIEDPELLGSHFAQLTKLIRCVPCYHLDYPRQFIQLKEVRQKLIDHTRTEPNHRI